MAIIIDRSTPLTLADTLGAVLTSIIDAQAQCARATVEFIKDVGLRDDGTNTGQEQLRTVQFTYRKLDENTELNIFQVEIPLLGMVDIPMISVKKATVSFEYDITGTTPPKKAAADPNTAPFKKFRLDTAVIRGRVARPSRGPAGAAETRESAGLKVSVELEKADMPVGLERIIDMLELASNETKQPLAPE